MEQDSKRDLYATFAVILVVIFIAVGVVVKNRSGNDNASLVSDVSSSDATVAVDTPSVESSATTETSTPDTTSTTPAPAAVSTTYKNGTYTATQKYSTPEDTESIKVTVTVQDDVITSVTATPTAFSRESKEYAGAFVDDYKTYVVGKSLKGLKLSRVSGASLTTQGFNNAISTIQSQAKA